MDTWRARAACARTDTNAFYEPFTAARLQRARVTCGGCPVRSECLRDALRREDFHGLQGGLTGQERRALLRQSKPRSRGRTRRSVLVHRQLDGGFVVMIAAGDTVTAHVITVAGVTHHSAHGAGRYRRLAAELRSARSAPAHPALRQEFA